MTGRRDWVVWLPTVLGVGVLLMMLILAAHRLLFPPPDTVAVLPAPVPPYRTAPAPPAWPAPAATPATTAPVTAPPTAVVVTSPSRRAVPGAPASRPRTTRPRTSRPAPPPPPVTGRYRVVDSYPDGFIGEVLVSNATDAPAGWVVTLRFADNVGELHTSWVESAPQATQSRVGDTYVWHSGAPVGGRSSVALRFHVARQGTGDRPLSCTVDGAACG